MDRLEDSRKERMDLFEYSEFLEVTNRTEVFIRAEAVPDMVMLLPPKPRKSKRINRKQKARGF